METYPGSVYIEHGGQPLWIITLDKYERDNLLLLLNSCGYPCAPDGGPGGIEPFHIFNSGDWIGQIVLKLAKPIYNTKYSPLNVVEGQSIQIDGKDSPNNQSVEKVRQDVEAWLRARK